MPAMPDPRHLVVTDPLPSTQSAASESRVPSRVTTRPAPQSGATRSAPSGGVGSPTRDAANMNNDGRDGDDGSGSLEGSPSPRYEQATPQRMRHDSSSRGPPASAAPRSARSYSRRLTDDEVASPYTACCDQRTGGCRHVQPRNAFRNSCPFHVHLHLKFDFSPWSVAPKATR